MKHIMLAAGFVLVGSLDYDPHILTLRYRDGTVEQMAATSQETCVAATRAIWSGLWQLDPMPIATSCKPGNLFSTRSTCIPNFNC